MSTVNVVQLQDHSYVCNIHLYKLHFYQKFMIKKFTPTVYNYAYVMLGEMGCFRSFGVRSMSWGVGRENVYNLFYIIYGTAPRCKIQQTKLFTKSYNNNIFTQRTS